MDTVMDMKIMDIIGYEWIPNMDLIMTKNLNLDMAMINIYRFYFKEVDIAVYGPTSIHLLLNFCSHLQCERKITNHVT